VSGNTLYKSRGGARYATIDQLST